MGGQSTSDSAVLNSGGQGNQSFDLRSWQGLTHVLKAGKDSLKDPQAYAEFRNLVLEYAQKGGDESLRKKIDMIIASFASAAPIQEARSFVPPLSKKEEVSVSVSEPEPVPEPETSEPPASTKVDAIVRRPEPVFIPRSERNNPAPVEPVVVEEKVEEVVPEPLEEETEPEEVEEVSVPEPLITKEDIAASLPVEESVLPPKPEPIRAPTPSSAATERVAVHKTMEEHKARISEIKRLVHEKVGNPAALMGAYNEAGKKYMVALLTALKATGAGSPIGIDTAMADLETAYEALVQGASAPSAPKMKEAEIIIPKAPVPEKKVEAQQPKPAPLRTPSAIAEALAADQKQRELKVAPIPAAPAPVVPPAVKKVEVKAAPIVPPPAPRVEIEQKPAPVPAEPVMPKRVVPLPEVPAPEKKVEIKTVPTVPPMPRAEVEKKITPPVPVTPVPPPVKPVIASSVPPIAKMPEIKKVPTEAKPQESTVPVYQSELFTPEVSKGVDSLLHEWPLFGGSGIFGMGPGGFEHPLYQKLANLSMGEVLAGRWEKADAKAIRTIKEYVDAWRHEQGIAYTINETFEHYLRRVVQRILKRQNS